MLFDQVRSNKSQCQVCYIPPPPHLCMGHYTPSAFPACWTLGLDLVQLNQFLIYVVQLQNFTANCCIMWLKYLVIQQRFLKNNSTQPENNCFFFFMPSLWLYVSLCLDSKFLSVYINHRYRYRYSRALSQSMCSANLCYRRILGTIMQCPA